jgi:hypothetical protein
VLNCKSKPVQDTQKISCGITHRSFLRLTNKIVSGDQHFKITPNAKSRQLVTLARILLFNIIRYNEYNNIHSTFINLEVDVVTDRTGDVDRGRGETEKPER